MAVLGKMAPNVTIAAAEAVRVAKEMGSTAADIVLFTEELGGEIPVVGTVLKTLAAIREKADTVQTNEEGLKTLEERCTYVTATVVVKLRHSSSSEMDVTPLESCIKDAEKLIERCSRRGWCGRCTKASSDKDEIAALIARVNGLAADLNLAGMVTIERDVKTILVSFLESRVRSQDSF